MHFACITLLFTQNEHSFVLVILRACDFLHLQLYCLSEQCSLTFVILTLSEAMRKDLCISLSLRRCSPTRTPSRWHPGAQRLNDVFSRMPSARSEEPVLSEAEGTYE